MSVCGGKFVAAVAVPVQARPRLEEREVREGLEVLEVLEVVNSYLSIPVTSFAVSRMEQVEIGTYHMICKTLKSFNLVSG